MSTLIRQATHDGDWDRAKFLVQAYLDWVDLDLSFQHIDQELASLSLKFARPAGNFFLANLHGKDVGCVGCWRLNQHDCEMKRLYVSPAARGNKLGEQLIQAVIDHARAQGYKRVLLDTISKMSHAHSLYKRMGFIEAEAYCFNPMPDVRYMQCLL